jgi:hypothetical protein
MTLDAGHWVCHSFFSTRRRAILHLSFGFLENTFDHLTVKAFHD